MITPKYVMKNRRKRRLRQSIRKRINGTVERPRLIFIRSNKYLYSQAYDDLNGRVLASVSTLEGDVRKKLKNTKNQDAAKVMGEVMAERLKKIKVKSVVFDRNVYTFTGRVKLFAESVREKGIHV